VEKEKAIMFRLVSDMALNELPYLPFTTLYAKDNKAFFADFAAVMEKMSTWGVVFTNTTKQFVW
jgi:hypothetical protein